jgi:hypothetical protein
MGLCSNGVTFFGTGIRRFGATAYQSAYPSILHGDMNQAGRNRNLTAGQGITSELVGIPSGNRHPSAWVMPQKAGALAARNAIEGSGAVSLTLISGVNAAAALAGSGSLTATGALIVSLVAALTGSGTITNAQAIAFLQLAATLAGSGQLTAAIRALASAAAALQGAGSASATATASGALAAAIVVTGDLLNTANAGAAVWGALAAANNSVGTMGEKLNDAGSASNPWTEIIESGYTAAEILRLIVAHAAGAATGLEGATPVFKSLDGTKDRITGTYAAGARGITDLDAT